jgi:hypothetical protein
MCAPPSTAHPRFYHVCTSCSRHQCRAAIACRLGRADLAALTRTIDSIVKKGAELPAAKETLPHDAFKEMVRSDLPFPERTAQELMAIARHPFLADASNWSLLPAALT